MELNAEQIKKALDWLDSLVGNSNDSDIALLTYQLLGILYDTCEELTAENERLRTAIPLWAKQCVELEERCMQLRADTVRKMQSEIEKRCIKGGIYPAFVKSTIDKIAKEMLEDAE